MFAWFTAFASAVLSDVMSLCCWLFIASSAWDPLPAFRPDAAALS